MPYLFLFLTAVFTLHIFSIFFPSDILAYCLGVLSFIMLLISFKRASRLFQILGVFFTVAGIALYFSADLSVNQVIPLLGDNLSLLTLLAVLPWMNSIVTAGRYDRLMQHLLRGNVKDLGQLYQRSTTTMMSLTAFLNVSSATIAQDVLVDNLKPVVKKTANKFIMMTTLRGYSLALPWSPLEVLLAMGIFITGVSYTTLMPLMVLITIVMYVLDSVWGRLYFKKYAYPVQEQANVGKQNGQNRSKIFQLVVALCSFLLLVILIGTIFDVEFIVSVTLLVFPFASLWALVIGRWQSFWTIGWNRWKNSVNHMDNFVVLFITLALFTNTLNESPALLMLQDPIIYVSDYPILILIMIQLLFVILSMFGVHPVATMGILSGISTMLMDILSPLSLAVSLIIGGVSTVPIGTYGLVVTITSMSLKQSPYYITYYNLIYSAVFGALGILLAYICI
ncbi:hypothetical protein MUN88_07755 [Gracilibacillus caseinilyticus]|uniref:Uncharacterized protein n=1 Tax=Gracilibacillus caseinilyticus TaxID=2932256 RepID=A0ABY4F669_9BACI|nr:hypothetical protein [Gracilibacillus caseinilyticus]UOQ49946.1 hypothetical protein MUN88_07755 [Gracilibacillus caseinilyticus]